MLGADAGDFSAGSLAGGFAAGGLFDFEVGDGGVVGDVCDHVTDAGEVDAADVADGSVEGAEDEFGAFDLDAAAEQGVDDFHERGLDGFLVFEEGGVMDARRGRTFDGAKHALVEVTELLSTESGGAATDSGDFDVSAVSRIWHIGPVGAVEICTIEIEADALLNQFVGALNYFFV